MTTSSSIGEPQLFYAVTPNIVTWEDPTPMVDATSITVSVCAPIIETLKSIFWTLAPAQTSNATRIFRCHVASAPLMMSRVQHARFISSVKKNPPGFSGTLVEVESSKVCIISELTRPEAVDMQYLTSYRTTALLSTSRGVTSDKLIQTMCQSVSEFSASGIATLRALSDALMVLRVLEFETYAVVQLIGSVVATKVAESQLDALHIKRISDISTVPEELTGWQNKHDR